jgi:hypothetical protein
MKCAELQNRGARVNRIWLEPRSSLRAKRSNPGERRAQRLLDRRALERTIAPGGRAESRRNYLSKPNPCVTLFYPTAKTPQSASGGQSDKLITVYRRSIGLWANRDFFIWIRRNPLISPNSAKGIQGNASFFAWISLVYLAFIWRCRDAHRATASPLSHVLL